MGARGRGVANASDAAGASYSALPVRLAPGSKQLRYLFIREHRTGERGSGAAGAAAADAGSAAERTLFIAAVPSCYGESEVLALMSTFGAVERVSEVRLASLPAPGAHVVFANAKGLRRALEAAQPGAAPQEPPPADAAVKRGLAKWVADHRAERPGLDVLQADVDAWIAAHDAEAAEAQAEQEAAAADDDGWTVVGAKRGRRKTTDGEGTAVGGVAPAKAARARNAAGPVGATDFYRHQLRENQRQAVVELRQKFEEDKKRIAELRAARKFKPY